MKKNSIEKSKYINERYKEYLRSSFEFGSGKLQKLFEQQLEIEDLFKGPYVDLSLPFKRGKNIEQLIDEGVVSRSFLKLADINFERPLYAHQEESIRRINSGRSAIITTGTGSGKTESFLYPILNELMKEYDVGDLDSGIRAIFLYPMNALVNDQIDRVRKILSECPEVTYGFFTGETKETIPKNFREKYKEENGVSIPLNELVSREEIRKNPPNLLFTNYSMLEYLLIRPSDYSMFNPNKLNHWKFVVLDEAHSYYGSLGIELSMLMRRLTGLAHKKPRFILTSATLGEEGKSENDIIDFAKSLTSATFEEQDIIFSKRIPLRGDDLNYSITGSDYLAINDAISNVQTIIDISKKYIETTEQNIKTLLYELLKNDKNVYQIFRTLRNGSKSFKKLLTAFDGSLTEKELIVLIDLINQAEKDGIGLFDLKYHSFVRPLAGAYITLGKEPKLSLTKSNMLDGLKAFEVGNCRYCSSPYIIGKIQHNEADNLDYLFQNKEVDIYENYGNNEFVNIDYFLMQNAVNEEEVDHKILEEYAVCSKCGSIHSKSNLNARKCLCGDSYQYTIYKVGQTTGDGEELAFNNINQCPCCGHKSRSGVVKGLNLGKDEGTALIAQILLEAIDEGQEIKRTENKLSLKLEAKNEPIVENKIKQFLSFSDSRQQASFAAAFMDSNHVRMLQKRLIWKVIEDRNYHDINVDELAAVLTSMIKEMNLFPNDLSAHKNAWITLLVDLLKVDGAYDGEGLGLYYFDLDVSNIMNCLTEEDVEADLGQYNISKKDLETLIQVVLSVFKVTPAISYVQSTLTPEEKLNALDYRRFDNYVMLNSQRATAGVRSFLPINSKDNMTVRYVQQVCSCNEERAKEILMIIFDGLAIRSGLLKKHASKDMYQIDASKYVVKNYKTSKYYRCEKCGRLTPYNIHNVCVQDKCDGTLVEVNPDEVLANNFYRNQYKTKKIEGVVIKEHTAQLDRKKAKQYQQDFKNKKINILSCSTTFEMGIDIGNLETVFMRNVPPSPANYVQRAGRAGRRKESAAYILTYCGTGSHDYTYFNEPEKMISGIITPPCFNVVNHKIILRHLMASCLGFFFRSNPDYFKSIDGLVFGDGVDKFKEYVSSHPRELIEYIDLKVIPESIYSRYHNLNWFDEIDGNDEKMDHFIETLRAVAEEYQRAKKEAINDEKFAEADYYTKQIENLHKQNVIESLSRYCVIPKYGFPVDLVELQVYEEGKLDNSYDLSRDLKIAISEYAPDSEIVVDGKKYTSKYISLPKTTQFPKNYFVTCPTCKKVNVFLTARTTDECKFCGESLVSEFVDFYIEPINGFKTGITKESTRMKPKRSYAGEVSYLGGGIRDDNCFSIGQAITVETSSNDELLVMNKSSFYMCPVCGYSDIIKGNIQTPTISKSHKNYRQFDCSCDELEQVRLGHRFQTDVARFTIPYLVSYSKEDYAKALSFMYAFLEGLSNALGIERNDIDGIIEMNLEHHSYDILLYDNVPGGAGHVKRLVNKKAIFESLLASYSKVSQKCCDDNTSCYNCLRNYYNQTHHSKLQRIFAKEVVETLLREIGVS